MADALTPQQARSAAEAMLSVLNTDGVVSPELAAWIASGDGLSRSFSEPNADYLQKLRDLIKSRSKDGDLSDEDVKAIIRMAAGYSGGKARARNRVTAESFAEGDGLWVGFWLPSDVAEEIALPGGELPGDLHLTLAYLGKTDELPSDAAERLRIAVQAFALTVEPFDIHLCGISRFSADDRSDDQDVIYAVVECESLQDFRWRLCMALYDAGLTPQSDHAFTPHVTLAYVQSDTIVTASLPNEEFSLDSLTVATSRNASSRETFMLRGVPYHDMAPLMMSERAMMEAPATIPVLPKPGTYTHPSYGKIDMSSERIASFVQNFEDQVYQDRLPIDLEHETKLSGAAGWITNLKTNTDGSVDAYVEWNDRGREALRDDRFFYISPEWYEEWRDPIDGKTHQNILMGAALTSRPFFKPAAMRSLAASEDPPRIALQEFPREESPMPNEPKKPENAGATGAPTPVTFTEEQVKRFAELESDNARLTTELTAAKTSSEQYGEQNKQLAERVTTMEKTARRDRFTAEVTGTSPSNNLRWFGEPANHVAVLENLADTVGEDSDLFKAHVAQNRGLAEQMKSSVLFRESGVTGADTSEEPQAKIIAMAERRATEKGISIRDAQIQINNENPELARQAGRAAAVRV